MPVTSTSFLSSQADQHINTDFFTDLKTADSTIHARFHIQYSSIKQTDTLPIYDRYGLGSENISMMMQLTAESWLLTCFRWIYHAVKQNKQITQSFWYFLNTFFLHFPWKYHTSAKMTWKTKCSTLEENREDSCFLFVVSIVSLVLLNNYFQLWYFGTVKKGRAKMQCMCRHHPLHTVEFMQCNSGC